MLIYSKEFKEKVINEYKNTDIATIDLVAKYNITKKTFYRWLNEINLNLPQKRKKRISTSIKQEIINKFKTGNYTVYQLSKNYHVNYYTISNWLIKLNLIQKRKKLILYTAQQKHVVIEDYKNSQISMKQLAIKYNINCTTISRWIHNSGIPIRHCRTDKKLIKQAIALYKEVQSLVQVSKQLNIRLNILSAWFKKYNIDIIPKYTKEFKQKIVNEYKNSDKSLNYFYIQYGIRHSLLTLWLKEANVLIRNSKVPVITNNIKEKVYNCYKQGMNKLQICKQFHISYKAIEDIINKSLLK